MREFKAFGTEDVKEDMSFDFKLARAHAKCYSDVLYILRRIEGVVNIEDLCDKAELVERLESIMKEFEE